jgi:hypothetical protein
MGSARASILVGGILMLVVGMAHAFFYRIFDWREAFAKVRVLDAKVFYTLHVALMLLGLVLAFVSLRYSDELSRGAGLGGTITVALAAFWLWRLVWQVVYFRPRRLRMAGRWLMFHYAWIALFVMLTVAYSWPVAARLLGLQ